MISNEERSTPEFWTSHWPVLILGLFLATALWTGWLVFGMKWSHEVAAQRVTEPIMGSQPVASSKVIVAPAVTPVSLDREKLFAEIGQTGDSFGGFNALLTAIAGALVAWAGVMQHQTLKQAKLDAMEERNHRKRQNFESLFFQLLQLSSSVTNNIERSRTVKSLGVQDATERVSGSRALDSYASSIFKALPETSRRETPDAFLNRLVEKFLLDVYDRKPSAFGPYFRLLFQTFKHIAESGLAEADQVRYANIARGQISEGALLLLALNGLTPVGYKFASLIEKFGLLEHLHRRYRAAYAGSLFTGYRPRAFMGSAERALPANAWIAIPLLPQERFAELSDKRTERDAQSDFEQGFDPEVPHDE
jgi:hypothetical protein